MTGCGRDYQFEVVPDSRPWPARPKDRKSACRRCLVLTLPDHDRWFATGSNVDGNWRRKYRSQGTTGRLWRIDLATKAIAEVDLGSTSIVNADGIVLRGHTLWVV
jgi:hypothetical protein